MIRTYQSGGGIEMNVIFSAAAMLIGALITVALKDRHGMR